MTVLLAAVAMAVPHHHQDCQSLACVERVAAKRCAQDRPVSCIHRASIRWRVSYTVLHRRAWCESRFDPLAQNASGASGLFQWMPSSWANQPYRRHSIWSAKYSSLAAAWAEHRGLGAMWVCR